MSRNLGYTRKFIILRKDYSNMINHNPKGHGKLELKGIKGNISLSLENAEGNNFYNVVLVGKNSTETIGKIYTEENGKGKAELALNLQELEARGFPIEKINGIIIIRDSDILLGGYIDKEDNSLERFISTVRIEEKSQYETPKLEEIKIDGIKAEAEELVVEEEVAIEWEEIKDPIIEEREIEEVKIEEAGIEEIKIEDLVIEPIIDIPEIEMIAIEIPDIDKPNIVDLEPIIQEDIVEDDITIYQKEAIEPTYEPLIETTYNREPVVLTKEDGLEVEFEAKDVDYVDQEYNRRITQRNQTTNYILSILRFFPYIDPFSLNLQGYNWWKIDFQEGMEAKGFLPYFSYLVGGDQKYKRTKDYVTAKDLLRKYEHYIFGLYNVKDEVKYYVYGVPGVFNKNEHPHKGTTGFNTWFEGKDINGYWLLYIDPLSGKIIYPANPMEPTN